MLWSISGFVALSSILMAAMALIELQTLQTRAPPPPPSWSTSPGSAVSRSAPSPRPRKQSKYKKSIEIIPDLYILYIYICIVIIWSISDLGFMWLKNSQSIVLNGFQWYVSCDDSQLGHSTRQTNGVDKEKQFSNVFNVCMSAHGMVLEASVERAKTANLKTAFPRLAPAASPWPVPTHALSKIIEEWGRVNESKVSVAHKMRNLDNSTKVVQQYNIRLR